MLGSNLRLLTCLASGLLVTSVTAAPIVITTADGSFGADNQIAGKNFGDREFVNKGNSPSIEIRNNSNPANNFVGVLRFDLSSITQTVQAATLSVTLQSAPVANTGLAVYALNEAAAGGGADGSGGAELSEIAYTEGTSNFTVINPPGTVLVGDIAPGFNELSTGTAMISGSSTLIGNAEVASTTPVNTTFNFDVAALVTALNADTNNAIVFYLVNTSTAGSFTLYTGDTPANIAFFPKLTVTVPEPASLALLGLGGLCLMGRRR